MAKIFRKRPGTTNKGTDYETLNIANIVLDLVADEKIKNFHISSNDEDFGAFDDVVVEMERENGTEQYALQLKHSDRSNLSIEQLRQAKGNFSLKKYFDSVQTLKDLKTKFILYTNLKFNVEEGTEFQLEGETFLITPTKLSSNNAFNFSQTTGCYYKFSIVDEGNYESCNKVPLYKEFFQNFFLYTDQENTFKLKQNVTEKFKASFYGNVLECDQFIKFLNDWSLQDGAKEKLNKKWMKLVIALKVLYSRVKPLSFNHNKERTQTDIVNAKIARRKILREAIADFEITVFDKRSYNKVKKLWGDAKPELDDLRTINKLRTKYQLASTNISDIAKVDSLTLSILLWLLGKCPLVLKQNANVNKILELCAGQKFILLRDNGVNFGQKHVGVFQTLSDLKAKTFQYNQLIENFTCTLQGKKETCLHNLIRDDEEILTLLTTDDLVEMTLGPCVIGETKENLPHPYIERSLLKNAIDIKILDNLTKDTVVVLDSVPQKKEVEKRLKRHNLINVHDYLKEQKDETWSLNIKPSFEGTSHTELSSLGSTIYFSYRRCEYSDFSDVCTQTADVKNYHHFRVRDDGNLEWIRSKGDVSHIEKYKLFQYYPIQECDLSSSEFQNINLLVSDPGMGKSEVMKSFKIKCSSDCFTVIIDPKDVHSFLKHTREINKPVDAFQRFLLDKKYKALSERDKSIFRSFLNQNKIIYVWDALDELSDKHRDIVTDIIVDLPKTCVQWVTSRCHLQNMLQKKLNVLALNLKKFDEEEQKDYIRERLADIGPKETVNMIIEKIESSFVLVEHKDILGIPLQIFMLTELFRQDREKYSALLNNFFTLTDLYNYFIEEKINIHYREKLGIIAFTEAAELTIQRQKGRMLDEYTNAALRLLFPDTILTQLAVQDKENYEEIQENDKNIGLVTEIKDQIPRFLHNSFAEYLAARYLTTKLEHKDILAEVMFDSKYNNVRFFFDLLLAGDSKTHIAVLYKNFTFIKSCESEILKSLDSGGRSVLHLACSWGQRYPELNVKYAGDSYTVDDEDIFRTVSESSDYLDTLDYLLEKCDISMSDQVYNMTPRQYSEKTTCLAAEMRVIMRLGTTLSIKTDHIINILYYSVLAGYYSEFKFFLQIFKKRFTFRRIIDNVKNTTGKTLLYVANMMGHVKIVQFLVTEGADIRLVDKNGDTPLILASSNGYDKIVEFLVKRGADVNRVDQDGNTPLTLASANGHYKVVKCLSKARADLNRVDKDGNTPLKLASSNGHDKIVNFLVKENADLKLANKYGNTPLQLASLNGYDKIVELLVKAGADIKLPDKDGNTPLKLASSNGHGKVVEFLVKVGADVNLADRKGETPLASASKAGHDKIVEFFVKTGANISLPDKNGNTPLKLASSKGEHKVVEFLVKVGADVNLADRKGETPLYAACCGGHYKIVEFLLNAGAAINTVTALNYPLCIASSFGYYEIVEFLVRAGVDINLGDKNGNTALALASEHNHYKIIEFLVQSGADINLASNNGYTPLCLASYSGQDAIVEFLVKRGTNINHVTKDGFTPLLFASKNGHYKISEFLIQSGADINLAHEDGSTPLKLAALWGHYKISEFLIKEGADINQVNKHGNSPVQGASAMGRENLVELLVTAGAEINLVDNDGDTPLHDASMHGHYNVVKLLVKAGADVNLANNDSLTPLQLASKHGYEEIVIFLTQLRAQVNHGCSHSF